MKKAFRGMLVFALTLGLIVAAGQAFAQSKTAAKSMVLKISHQWPGGTIDKGDYRDRMVRIFAKKVEERTAGAIKFEIHPASVLFKPVGQYDAMLKGALDMAVYPLDYASGKVPQLSITLMPCIVRDHHQAIRWKDEPIGKEVEKILEQNGIRMIAWNWCGGGVATKSKQVIIPEDLRGMKIRGAGKMFETMLHDGAGCAITSMPSSEIYFALQTGVLDACMTSSSTFESFRLYEQVKYYTSPRITTTWYMNVSFVMSMLTWKKLSPDQQKIFTEVGKEMEKFGMEEAIKDDVQVTELFKQKGVQVYDLTPNDFKAWLEVAKKTAWKTFAEKVKGGKELLEMAQAVK